MAHPDEDPAGMPDGSETILLVGDDRHAITALTTALYTGGLMNVSIIDCSGAPRSLSSSTRFDLAVIDLSDPPPCGLGRLLPAQRPAHLPPLVVIGAHDPCDYHCRAGGAFVACLPKPVEREDFLHLVRDVLGGRAGSSPAVQ